MNSWLRRFAAVGLIATIIDIGLAVVLLKAGLPSLIAGIFALVTAASTARFLHEKITLKDDPHARWIRDLKVFITVVVIAGAVDLILLTLLISEESWSSYLLAKVTAVLGAAVTRGFAYRFVLFHSIRSEQGQPSIEKNAKGDPSNPRVSLVIPTFQEADRIAETIFQIRTQLGESLDSSKDLEIIVVDDGSSDATAKAAERAGANLVIEFKNNRGKGAAVRAGVAAANGSTVAFTDADLAYSPRQILRFISLVESGYDVAVGSRQHLETKRLVRLGRFRELGGRLVNLATLVLLLGQYRDTQCGLKAFKSKVAKSLFSAGSIEGFSFDVELFHLIERWGLSLIEVPVEVENSKRSTVNVFRDGFFLLIDLFRIRQKARRGDYPDPSFDV